MHSCGSDSEIRRFRCLKAILFSALPVTDDSERIREISVLAGQSRKKIALPRRVRGGPKQRTENEEVTLKSVRLSKLASFVPNLLVYGKASCRLAPHGI